MSCTGLITLPSAHGSHELTLTHSTNLSNAHPEKNQCRGTDPATVINMFWSCSIISNIIFGGLNDKIDNYLLLATLDVPSATLYYSAAVADIQYKMLLLDSSDRK